MALLSLLGEKHISIDTKRDHKLVDVLATRSTKFSTISVMVVVQNNTEESNEAMSNVFIRLKNITNVMYAILTLDNDACNPYKLWKSYNSPDFPSLNLQKKMRDAEVQYKENTS